MQGVHSRKYGVEATIPFVLCQTDGIDYKADAVHAAGDTKIMKDEGDEANTTNGFVDEGQGYSITLTATEMQAARIVVYIVDQGTKVWLDTAIVIETYGHANAMHAFDLGSAEVTTDSASRTASKADVSSLAIEATLTAIKGAGWNASADTLEKIREAVANIPAQRQTQEI